MTQAIANYDALWQSLQTRRRPVKHRRGLDELAAQWLMRSHHARWGLSRWKRLARRVDALDQHYSAMSDADLDQRVAEHRDTFVRRRIDDQRLVEAMAALRQVAHRQVGLKPYFVQLVAALAMYHGQIVEMKTGEGKTLTAALAVALLAWSRPGVHVVTANDYLAGRDAQSMGPIYQRAGVSCACVLPTHSPAERVGRYRHGIVYTTQKELVGDWLRDQIRLGGLRDAVTQRLASSDVEAPIPGVLVPGLHAVVVDEADAVLIDQAVTPLVISSARGTNQSPQIYRRAAMLAAKLVENEDYQVQMSRRRVQLTEAGRRRLAELITADDRGIWRAARRRRELVEQALAATHCYQCGEQYEIVEDRVTMVDQFTGRFKVDHQWQYGIQQAVEANEQLEITGDSRSLASMSFQRFFRHYPFLAGMTGTATGSRAEFERTYGVPVRVIATNRPVIRKSLSTQIFIDSDSRWRAVVDEVEQLHATGRPILIGTRSVAASTQLSQRLSDRGLPHQVLNAVHHEREAQIVAEAGVRAAITVATNMAGRGTDIKLGPGVAELGGLYVILTERHAAGRIDKQLQGRAGRQGDPGSSQIFVSLEDQLLAIHGPVVVKWARRLYAGRAGPTGSRLVKLAFALAQRRAQRRAFATRRAVARHDDWLDQAMPNR